MNIKEIVSGLPAILAVVFLVIYQLLKRHGKGDANTKLIIEKIRGKNPDKFSEYSKLNSRALLRKIDSDASLRRLVAGHDFDLLKQSLRQQFALSVIVYLLCGGVFAFGVKEYVAFAGSKAKAYDLFRSELRIIKEKMDALLALNPTREESWGDPRIAEQIRKHIAELEPKLRNLPDVLRETDEKFGPPQQPIDLSLITQCIELITRAKTAEQRYKGRLSAEKKAVVPDVSPVNSIMPSTVRGTPPPEPTPDAARMARPDPKNSSQPPKTDPADARPPSKVKIGVTVD